MKRREFLGAAAAAAGGRFGHRARVGASARAERRGRPPAKIPRKGRIKQGLWR